MVLVLLEAADAPKAEASREAAQLQAEEARVRFSKLPTPTSETPAVISLPEGSERRLAEAYARAGVEQRVVDSLPVSLAVLGRKVILLSLPNEDGPSLITFHAATIRHQGMAQLLTAAFDHLWAQAQPFVTSDAGPEHEPSAADRIEVSR